jgi:hypothetical protein
MRATPSEIRESWQQHNAIPKMHRMARLGVLFAASHFTIVVTYFAWLWAHFDWSNHSLIGPLLSLLLYPYAYYLVVKRWNWHRVYILLHHSSTMMYYNAVVYMLLFFDEANKETSTMARLGVACINLVNMIVCLGAWFYLKTYLDVICGPLTPVFK